MKKWYDVEIRRRVDDRIVITVEASSAEEAEDKARQCNEAGDLDDLWGGWHENVSDTYDATESDE